jgi:DinB superfamily
MLHHKTLSVMSNYTTLSLADVAAELSAIARDTQAVFGLLNEQQLNWRPTATSWSVAQCFDHLLSANREMFRAVADATDGSSPPTLWQRLPFLPRVFGLMLIKSQMPDAKRKFTAPRKAAPASSAIDAQIIERFVAYQHEAAARVRSLEGRDLAAVIMTSPFVSFITYSVLDGCRLIVTHERRHFEQARRVTREPRFPP